MQYEPLKLWLYEFSTFSISLFGKSLQKNSPNLEFPQSHLKFLLVHNSTILSKNKKKQNHQIQTNCNTLIYNIIQENVSSVKTSRKRIFFFFLDISPLGLKPCFILACIIGKELKMYASSK